METDLVKHYNCGGCRKLHLRGPFLKSFRSKERLTGKTQMEIKIGAFTLNHREITNQIEH
jgi:hypothetical protein